MITDRKNTVRPEEDTQCPSRRVNNIKEAKDFNPNPIIQKPAYVLLLDADECIYNSDLYHKIYLHLMVEHLDFFERFDQLTDEEVAAIIGDISKIKITSGTFDLKNSPESLLDRLMSSRMPFLKQQLLTMDAEQSDKFKFNFQSAQARWFQKKLAVLDPQHRIRKYILYRANMKLFDSEVEFLRDNPQLEAFEIACASNRQSNSWDQHNSDRNGTDLFAEDLPLIRDIFNDLLGEKHPYRCEYDSFNLAKLFGEENTPYDTSKYLILQALTDYYSFKYSQALLNWVDDLEDIQSIILALHKRTNRKLLANNIGLQTCLYDGYTKEVSEIIEGAALADRFYPERIKQMQQLGSSNNNDPKTNINVARMLLQNKQASTFADARYAENSQVQGISTFARVSTETPIANIESGMRFLTVETASLKSQSP